MNELLLRGKLIHKGDEKFISYCTQSREHLLPIKADGDFADNTWVLFSGSLFSQNYFENEKRRKRYFAQGVIEETEDEYYQNDFILTGTVVRLFDLRTTPLTNRKIVDFVVALGDSYYNCVAFGSIAEMLLKSKKVGDSITFNSASFQSRVYEKLGETKIAYEVCIRSFS